jgi:uncharacterized protein (DUF1778 family)
MSLKDQNLHMRISKDDKQLLNMAANRVNMNLTSFVVESAKEKAYETLKNRRHITLTKRDMNRLLEILDDEEPEEVLREGFAYYNKVMGNG